jgi:hypothetical protein
MQTNDVIALKHQQEFIYSTHTHTGLVAGLGAGKSKAGTIKTVVKKMEYPGISVAYYLPTYPLIKEIAVPNFSDFLNQMEIPFRYHETDKIFHTSFGKIILRSTDKPEFIIGYEVGYSLIDEADVLPKKKMANIFKKIAARNRVPLPDGSINCIDLVSTPEGFEFMYEFFVKDAKPNRRLIKARTGDNPFLPESYIDTLREIYTHEELEAYLNGEFVNLTSGTVYHKFSRIDNHSARTILPRETLHVGMDFNITNMSAVIHVTDGPRVIAVAEITGAYDTPDMIKLINQRFPGHKIVVYPDASGANRKTSASDTDIDLLRKAGFVIRVDKSNPSVRDRITKLNSGFLNGKGERTYFVNTKTCQDYTEALEKLPYKNGVPDKESGYDHITEAGGYCLFKIVKPSYSSMRAR